MESNSNGWFKENSWFSQFRNGSNPLMARYVYALMFLVANLLAWAVRDYGRGALTEVQSKLYTHFPHYPHLFFFFCFLFYGL